METFVNDTPRLTVDAGIDISGYATKQIRYIRPDGTLGCWGATQDPDDNQRLYYDCAIGDLNQSGEWIVQGIALDAGVRLTGRWCSFDVHDPIRQTCTTAAPTTVPPTTAAP